MSQARIYFVKLNLDDFAATVAGLDSDLEYRQFVDGFLVGARGFEARDTWSEAKINGHAIGDGCFKDAQRFSASQREKVMHRYQGESTELPRNYHGSTGELPENYLTNNQQPTTNRDGAAASPPLLPEADKIAPFLELWNSKLVPHGYGKADRATKKRKDCLKARLKDNPAFMETFAKAVDYLAMDAWWLGKASQFTIDLLLCQVNRAQELSEKTPSRPKTNGPSHRASADQSLLDQLANQEKEAPSATKYNAIEEFLAQM